MNIDLSPLAGLKDIAESMPAAPAVVIPPPPVVCAFCGHKLAAEQRRQCTTPLVVAEDNICPTCWSMVATHAKIVCLRCKCVVARIPPHTDRSGFKFEDQGNYHIDRCPICLPGTESSTVLEKAQFDVDMKRK